jgi:hypothetical protein
LRLTDKARQRVDQLLQIEVPPKTKSDGKGGTINIVAQTSTFVTAACWADDIKSNANREWHFLDIPFSPDGTIPDVQIPAKNVVTVIADCVANLKDASASDQDKAKALRFLIHLVGDCHQPLHCATRCTHENADGDRGGNDFHVVGAKNLHSYWDGGVTLFTDVKRPLSAQGKAKILGYANTFTNAYPASSMPSKVKNLNPESWAKDSNELAVSAAYNLPENSKPSSSYKTKAKKVVRNQVALAGYRLAAVLNDIYK